jgi:signal peptidase I
MHYRSLLKAATLACTIALGLSFTPSSLAQDQDRQDIGLQKQLLVDDYVIADMENITRAMGEVQKQGIVVEPSLPLDFIPPLGQRGDDYYEDDLETGKKPDGSPVALDFGYYTTVLRNEQEDKFQMWYMAWRLAGVGYAESTDGIHWTKPMVGADGTNNIVHSSQGFSCSIDPSLPWGHPEKYKGAADFVESNSQLGICYSADGIHWSDYNDGKHVTYRAADTHNQILWDPIKENLRLLTRTDLAGEGGADEWRSQRIMVHEKDNDLMNHPTAWKTVADKIAVDDPSKEMNEHGNPRLQFNGMTNWIYEGVYFGLMDVYTMDRSGFFEGFDYDTRHDHDYMDFYIGTSRDGMTYDKSWVYARKPIVPRGEAGSFDKDGVKPPSQILTYNDEHWIYYGGMDERHYSIGRHLNIGLAKLRLDGFISLDAGDEWGQVTTKPFALKGDALEINIDASVGEFFVEVLDADGQSISEYDKDHSTIRKSLNQIRFMNRWNGDKDLSALKGEVIQLRFHLRNAKLYSFTIKES